MVQRLPTTRRIHPSRSKRAADVRARCETALREIWTSWEERASAKRALAERIPAVRTRAHEELLETIEFTLSSI